MPMYPPFFKPAYFGPARQRGRGGMASSQLQYPPKDKSGKRGTLGGGGGSRETGEMWTINGREQSPGRKTGGSLFVSTSKSLGLLSYFPLN